VVWNFFSSFLFFFRDEGRLRKKNFTCLKISFLLWSYSYGRPAAPLRPLTCGKQPANPGGNKQHRMCVYLES